MVNVPSSFDSRALAEARALADGGDRLLADALTRAGDDGRIAQDLAGGPALLERYQTGGPAARALLEAAMDARRLGVGLHLPQAFLTDAAPDYLHDSDWDQLTDEWAEKAYAELAERVHGKRAPLSRAAPRPRRRAPDPSPQHDSSPPRPREPILRLADYLEQYGRTTRHHVCPPASFWHSAHTHLTHPDDLDNLASAAVRRHRLQWAHYLRLRAAEHGGADTLADAACMGEQSGDGEAAEPDDADTMADAAWTGEEAGDEEATAPDHADTMADLALRREEAGDREAAETLAWQADDHGDSYALARLVRMRERAGDRAGAEALARQAAARRRNTNALVFLAMGRDLTGDRAGAEALARLAADYGDAVVLPILVRTREGRGDRAGAEALARLSADYGSTSALFDLAREREEAGDRESAEILARRAADQGVSTFDYEVPQPLGELWPHGLDPDGTPTPPWQ